jgi:hypothetical protein
MSTTIKIGHASISENNTAFGDAGDQTGREVRIVDKYDIEDIEPYIVLRPKTASLASASVAACIAGCNNANIGYSQSTRNTLYNLAKVLDFDLSQVGLCNTDCSAFMTVCALAGGAKITYGSNAPTTSNMRTRFSQSGDYTVLTNSKYTTKTDYLKAGDILVHEGTHTMMVLENGSESPSEGDEPDLPQNLQTYNILPKVTKINNTSVTINIKTVKQVNELETPTSNSSWSYFLEYRKLSSTTPIEQAITNNTISLSGLAKDTCYIYRIKVKKNNADFFCSAYKTFNTAKDLQELGSLVAASNKHIEVAYIKTTASGYLPVTVYVNKGV